MDTKQFEALLRRAFSKGLSGEEEFQLELEAAANDEAKAMLEQAEQDDVRMSGLRAALAPTRRWYESRLFAIAATAVAAVGVTLLSTNTILRPDAGTGLASPNVVYLETVRGAGMDQLPTVAVGNPDEWVTLVAYPAPGDFSEYRVVLERLEGDGAEPSADTWFPVWERRTNVGNQDSVAVTLRGDLLTEGVYRLQVEGLIANASTYAIAADLRFRVTD